MDEREREPKPTFGSVDDETRRRMLEGADRAAESLPSGRRRTSPPSQGEEEEEGSFSTDPPPPEPREWGRKGGEAAEREEKPGPDQT